MSKCRLAVLVLLAVTVVYGVTLALSMWNYCQIPTEGYDPDLGHWFGNPDPFFSTSKGFMFVMSGAVLFSMWFIVAFRRELWKSKEKKKLLALALFFSLTFTLFSSIKTVNAEASTPFIRVGVLCVGDEEFMADPENVGRTERAIQRANNYTSVWCLDCFELTFGLHFEVVCWTTWESDNDVHDSRNMAWEVWNKTGFYTGMVVNGQYVDMLCACTGQDIEGYHAVTFPNANITLIEELDSFNGGVIRHELSHQFYCPECDGKCVMNIDYIYRKCPCHDWCPNCFQVVNDNKFKFTVIGDVSGDYKVDMRDVRPAVKAFGSVKGDANWAASCDIDGDGTIDMYDIRVISSHFGESRY